VFDFRLDYKLSLFIFLLYPHSQSGGYTGIPLSVRPSLNLVCVTSHLSLLDFIHIYFIFFTIKDRSGIYLVKK
jgi:hypothetical protein